MSDKPKKVALIAGDGIGPEVVESCTKVIEATGVLIHWIPVEAGGSSLVKGKEIIPQETLKIISDCGVAYKGPLMTPVGTGHRSANVLLRQHFTLFANVRPIRSIVGIKTRYENIDLVVVRENTEDLYSGLEHIVVPGVVESIKVITAQASERIARFTFDYCRKNKRKKVTVAHKANIMKLSDGLFLESIKKVHREYSEISYEEMIVDNLCNQLVIRPETFDVILATNFYGDIISDLCAGFVGGLGVVPGANYGTDCAIFEAVHGTAPDIAQKGVANPTAMLLSGCLMLEYLGFEKESKKILHALELIFSRVKKNLTKDLGGEASTSEFTKSLIEEVKK